MKVLVTGATGFLGSHLIPELLARGHQVGYVARAGSALLPERDGCRVWTVGDSGEGVREALAACCPDVVVHLAAIVGYPACRKDPQLAEEVNVQGTKNVAAAVSRNIARHPRRSCRPGPKRCGSFLLKILCPAMVL